MSTIEAYNISLKQLVIIFWAALLFGIKNETFLLEKDFIINKKKYVWRTLNGCDTLFTLPKPGVKEFLNAFDINLFCVSDDEMNIAISTNLSGQYDIWMLELPSAYPYPLTCVGQKPQRLYFDPLDRHLLATFDHEGNEKTQIFAIGLNGGDLVPIIQSEHATYHLQALSTDGSHIYYATDNDNPQYMNSYKRNLITGKEEIVLKGEETLTFIMAVSPDEKSFTYNKAFSNSYMEGYVWKDGDHIHLIPNTDTPHRVRSHRYFGNDTIFFWTDFNKEYSYVGQYDICSRKFSEVFSVNGEDVVDIQIDNKNDRMYIFTTRGVQDHLYELNLIDYTSKKIPLPVSVAHHIQIAKSGNLYICGVSETIPSNLFKYDCLKEEWEQITKNRIMGISADELTQSQTIMYKSFDGLNIEALLYEPREDILNGYTIIWPHGGPQSSMRKNYQGMIQFFCSRGFKFFAPNFRGSIGYGKAFMKKVERDWGEAPRLDMVEGIEWLIQNGKAERGKLFLMGKSFGGYMSLLLHGRHGEYFKAIVDMYGETDLLLFLETVPESWKPLMARRLGDIHKDRDRLIADSPITYVDHMTKPMLIIHGANDNRVVKQQSDILVEELRGKNRVVDYIVLENEGHGFVKKDNEIMIYQRIVDFFEEHMNES